MRKREKRALSRSFFRCLGPFGAQSKRAGILAGLHLRRFHRLNQIDPGNAEESALHTQKSRGLYSDAPGEPGVGQLIIHQ